MRVERSRDAERDIAYLLKALYTVDETWRETWCVKYGGKCYKCPLGKLGVFDTPTCHEIIKVKSRLELIYRVVETL